MTVVVDGDGEGSRRAVASDGDRVVLTATALDEGAAAALTPVEPVTPLAAQAVSGVYRGLIEHPFPTCFVCGHDRADDDGLRLTPGMLPGVDDHTACTWVPEGDVDTAQTWASVDCPGGWSVDLVGRPMVLGSLTVAVQRVPRSGEVCVVVGAARGTQGRKTSTAATLWSFGADGSAEPQQLATAEHVWVAVDPATFGPPGPSRQQLR